MVGNVFQSTYLYKVRRIDILDLEIKVKFQSTYLYKVRRLAGVVVVPEEEFQSTYLYKVRPLQPVICYQSNRVSIHVPI